MKVQFLASVFFLCVVGFQQVMTQGSEGYASLVERVMPSIVLVNAIDSSGRDLRHGTGFCVARNLFVTNFHVVRGASRIQVRTYENQTYTVVTDSILEKSDLALLKAGYDVCDRPLRFAAATPKPGERIIVVGNPLGLSGSVSDGIVSALRDGDELVQITAPISPGSSGSPVINLRGDVIGVATLNLKGGQNLNFAVSASHITSVWPKVLSIARNTAVKPTRSRSSRWRLLNDDDTTYDKQTLTTIGGVVSVWINYSEKDGSYDKVLNEINCESRKIRTVQSTTYDVEGRVVASKDVPSSWAAVIPDSNGEGYFQVFCKGKPDRQAETESEELYDSGRGYEADSNFRVAIEAYWKVVRLGDEYKLRSFVIYANAMFATMDLERIYRKLDDVPGLEKLYQYEIAKGSRHKYEDLAVLYKKHGMNAKFRSTLAKGFEAFTPKAGKKPVADDYFGLASLYKLQSQTQQAIATLLKGLKIFPSDASLIISLGSIYNDLRRWRDCVKLVEEALPGLELSNGKAVLAVSRRQLLTLLKTAYKHLGDRSNAGRIDRELSTMN